MISTPLSPGDALSRYPPFHARTKVSFGPADRKGKKSHLHREGWIVDNSKAFGAVVTRSISASEVPILHRQMREHRSPSGIKFQRPGHHRHGTEYIVRPNINKYSESQIASLRHYQAKTRRLSSQEYVNWKDWPDHSPRLEHQRIVELDTESAYSHTAAHTEAQSPSPAPKRVLPIDSKGFIASSPIKQARQLAIVRKPVPSAPTTPHSRNSNISAFDWDENDTTHSPPTPPPETLPELIPESPILGSPWDDQSPPPSPSPQQPSRQRTTTTTKSPTKSTALPSKASKSNLNNPPHPKTHPTTRITTQPASTQPSRYKYLLDPSVYFALFFTFIEDAIRQENREHIARWSLWTAKMLLILYLAACVWNVVAAVRDAVLRAFAPLWAFWELVGWVFGR
ncbi:hypothetical protein BT63DRAFT_417340 [Microthyrium microscopicum]|uniref:Uncharacterized protein n=1 Tax=Microthyrium microscopicum TaxID=703497 RepID=A0A6A6U0J2_9PEZI|nr:hypothetical protein BT63DRAFT_417340 [Microthyrium microscopicum]